jgi:hypothetical protein
MQFIGDEGQTETDVKPQTCFIYTQRNNRSDNRDGIIILKMGKTQVLRM